ncbi:MULTISPECIES: hypothetical protein [Tenebrionibacter/Tenebrionicola group]|jgi:uncharacterized protein YcfJ|uniref:Uncharacterized protein n=2 Tax=Tenebrionibacter/Tenebrionicola group TaxID=2969848 RepID=A0A8K0V211_9ENTR|nr:MULTISPECIES: hypothetical protein [Tenebrionibacter/Tenebrionicola group]MBK4715538.1 hypothetical protein [Tenebrionibacter intestinalis]MBV4411315.1 hypothetical protein [Tenebrionicola larvae]MBV5095781.1 hypothetical protein [Tenebrionicola larvae]
MRELNSVEVNAVSGAGFIADIGAVLGEGIGKFIDAATGKTGNATAGLNAGQHIGETIEKALSPICSIWASIFGTRK